MIYQFISGFMKKYNLPDKSKNDVKRVVQKLQGLELNGGKINTFLTIGEPPTKQLEEKLSVLVEENEELKQKLIQVADLHTDEIKLKDKKIEELEDEIKKLKEEIERLKEENKKLKEEVSVCSGGSNEEKKKRGRPKKA